MNRVPPDSTRTYTPFPYTTLFRSQRQRRDLRSDAAKGGEFRHRAGNAAVVRVDDLPRDAPQVARLRFGEGGAMEQIGEGRLVQGGELVRRVRDGEQAKADFDGRLIARPRRNQAADELLEGRAVRS